MAKPPIPGSETGRTVRFRRGIFGSALGADQIGLLTSQYGLSREELLDGLSEHLPELVDHLTPGGQVPSPEEMQRLI